MTQITACAHGCSGKARSAVLNQYSKAFPDGHNFPTTLSGLATVLQPLMVRSSNFGTRLYCCSSMLLMSSPGAQPAWKENSIPACPNACLLYHNEWKDLDACVKCGTPRFTAGGKQSFLRYFSVEDVIKGIWRNPVLAQVHHGVCECPDSGGVDGFGATCAASMGGILGT
jgi:hypothetical protein